MHHCVSIVLYVHIVLYEVDHNVCWAGHQDAVIYVIYYFNHVVYRVVGHNLYTRCGLCCRSYTGLRHYR